MAPGGLAGASAQQAALASSMLAVSGQLQATGAQCAEGAGPAVAAVITGSFAQVASSLAQLAASVSGTAENLTAAAAAYTIVDAQSIGR